MLDFQLEKFKSNKLMMHLASSVGLKIITFIIMLVQGIIIARYLLPEGRGTIAVYMVTFNFIFSLLNLGIRQSSSYFLSKENMMISKIITAQLLILIGSTLFGIFILILAYSIQGYIDNQFILILILFLFPLRLYINATNSIALSNRWIYKFNVSQLLLVLIEFFTILIFIVYLGKGVEYYFLALLLASFFTAIYILLWIKKIEDYKLNFEDIFSNIKKITIKGISYSIPLFVFGLNYSIDVLLLQKYVSIENVGIYTLGVSLSTLLWQIPTMLGPIIFSYGVSTKNPIEFSRRLWKNTWKLMVYLIPILIVLLYILPYLIPMVYGEAFRKSYEVFMYLLFGTYMMIAFKMLNGDLAARGNPTAGLYIFSAGVVLNIILNIILIPKYGINGAAIASSISYTTCAILFIFKYKSIALKEK